MLVPVRVGRSSIHGLGLFAARRILKGEVVWKFRDPPDFRLPMEAVQWSPSVSVYGWVLKDADCVEMPGDAAMYVNHSADPNMGFDPQDGGATRDLRDIQEGEELTENYFEYDRLTQEGGFPHMGVSGGTP